MANQKDEHKNNISDTMENFSRQSASFIFEDLKNLDVDLDTIMFPQDDKNKKSIKTIEESSSRSLNLENSMKQAKGSGDSKGLLESSENGDIPTIPKGRANSIIVEDQPSGSSERLMRIVNLDISKKESFLDKCSDICRRKECLDSRTILSPIKRTESQELAFEIEAIEQRIALNENPVPAIHSVELRRKVKHENIVREMILRMDDLNQSIESEIRKQAQCVLSNIHLISENVEKILSNIEPKSYARLSKKKIDRMQEIIILLNESRLRKIKSYCDFLWTIEGQRSESFKKILKNTYSEMNAIMYLLPLEIQKFFEEKIKHLNEITMNNYHCYIELEESLKLQMEEELRGWFLKLKLHEESDSKEVKQSIVEPELKAITQEIEEIKMDMKKDIEDKIESAKEAFDKFKAFMKRCTFLKGHPIIQLLEDYCNEIKNAGLSIIKAGLVGDDGIKLNPKVIENLSTAHGIDEEELQNLWLNGIESLLRTFEDNLKILKYSIKLFDCYCDRSFELKTLYSQQLFLMIAKNDRATMRMNTRINTLIDKLRQAPSEDSLNKALDEIESTIFLIDTLIQSHLKDELSLLEKYHQFGLTNADILIDELARYVTQFPPPPDSDPRVMKKRASWMDVDELKNNDHLFTKDFLNCRYIMQGIDNWQFGIWHALLTMMDYVKGIISKKLMLWTNEEKEILTNRSDLKMKINNARIKCIKEDFWKVRLGELLLHEDRLKEHELALKAEVTELNNLKRNFEVTCSNIVFAKYNRDIEAIMKNHIHVDEKRHVVTLMKNIRDLDSMLKDEIENEFLNLTETSLEILNDMRTSHMLFMKSIKFFHENGNFNAGKSKALIKKFIAAEKIIVKEFNAKKEHPKMVDFFIGECEKRLDYFLQIIYKRIDEFDFAKNVDDRLKKLHANLADSMFIIKCDIRKLEARMRSFREASYAKENLGSYDWLFPFSKCFRELLTEIDTFKDNFFFDEGSVPEENFLRTRETSRVSLPLTPQEKPKPKKTLESRTGSNRRKTIKSATLLNRTKNYVHLLYPTAPPENSGYLSKLTNHIYRSFCEIQEEAKNFYDAHGEVLNKKCLAPDFRTFAEEILNRLKYYHLQSEFFWMECLIEFIEQLTNFRRFLENYYTDTLTEYVEDRHKMLTEKAEIIIKDLEKNLDVVEDYYLMIHKKLKPMFGHPKLSKMLELIDSYVRQGKDFCNQQVLDSLEPKKEIIKAHCINTESIFLDMERILSCVRGSTTALIIQSELHDLIVNKMSRLKNIVALEETELPSKLCSYRQNMINKLHKLKQNVVMPDELELSHSDILESIEDVPRGNMIDTDQMVKSNYEKCESYANKIASFEERCSKIHKKYENMWNQDCNKILQLFKIKYDFPVPE